MDAIKVLLFENYFSIFYFRFVWTVFCFQTDKIFSLWGSDTCFTVYSLLKSLFSKNNYFTAARANSDLKLVDFSKLLSLLFSDSEKAVKDLVNDKDFEFIVHYPEIYKKLNDYINSDKVSAKTLWNHYHFSVLIGNFLMLYKVKVPDENNLNVLVQTEPFVGLTNLMKRKNEDKNLPNPLPIPEPEIPKSTLNSFTAANTYCLGKVQVDKTFRQLIDRLYLDKAYPDKQDRRVKQNFVRKLANNIIHGFQVTILFKIRNLILGSFINWEN